MYDSNNVHILMYLAFGFIAIIIGKITAWSITRFGQEKNIVSKEFFKTNRKGLEKNYICIISLIIIYCLLLYKFGISDNFVKNLDLIKFMILTPMLIITFFVDLKKRIIPNRLNLTIFEIGLILTFIYGVNNINIAQDMLLGMITGFGIFGAITLIGGIIEGKEAMGMGDVKFVGAIGLYFGLSSIVQIAILAFFLGAVFSIILIIVRNIILKSKDEYMPFGPFLAVSAVACMFLQNNEIFTYFMLLCQNIVQKIT